LPSDVPLLAGAMAADNIAGADLAPGVAEQMPLRAANNDADQFIYHWSYVPPGWGELGVGAYHGLELVYLFNYPLSFISHHLLRSPDTDFSALTGLTDEDIGANPSSAAYFSQIMLSTGYYDAAAGSAGLTEDVLSIWSNFAKFSDPSVEGVIEWPVYTGHPDDGGNDAFVEIRSDEANGYAIETDTGVDEAFGVIF
jgi:para-nitrobenzyl esterase